MLCAIVGLNSGNNKTTHEAIQNERKRDNFPQKSVLVFVENRQKFAFFIFNGDELCGAGSIVFVSRLPISMKKIKIQRLEEMEYRIYKKYLVCCVFYCRGCHCRCCYEAVFSILCLCGKHERRHRSRLWEQRTQWNRMQERKNGSVCFCVCVWCCFELCIIIFIITIITNLCGECCAATPLVRRLHSFILLWIFYLLLFCAHFFFFADSLARPVAEANGWKTFLLIFCCGFCSFIGQTTTMHGPTKETKNLTTFDTILDPNLINVDRRGNATPNYTNPVHRAQRDWQTPR